MEEDNLSATKASDLATKYGVAIPSLRSKAVEAFAQRKVGGLNLSQRVWNITDTFYKEVETAFDIALRDGTPANRLATEIKQYLKSPDKLFRRVRDEHGQLQLSKKAREFHPGQGVYRSSYRNARRLAVIETNMAYHKADNERWRQLDFVLGYEVKVSGTNPNVCPLCMELEGKYPKEFEFVGWHPHCRCHAIPILEKPEDFLKRQQAFLQGQHVPPLGAVKQPPQNFLQHLKDNQERLQQASKRGTLPYFIRDNYKVTKKGELTPIFARQKNQPTPSIQETVKARQKARTPIQTQVPSFKAIPPRLPKNEKKINNHIEKLANNIEKVTAAKVEYLNHNAHQWEQTFFNLRNGGYLVRNRKRVAKGRINKQERHKLDKETRMAITFAKAGYKVKMIEEKTRDSCYDALINGVKAEFKSVSSPKQIVRHAKKATREQGAEIVLFEFHSFTSQYVEELEKLKKIGIHGLFYVIREARIRKF